MDDSTPPVASTSTNVLESATSTSTPFTILIDKLQSSLEDLNKKSLLLPSTELNFEKSLSRPLNNSLKLQSDSILSTVSNLLNWLEPTTTKIELDSEMIKDGFYKNVINLTDKLLERVDDGLEFELGVGKSKPITSSNRLTGLVGSNSGSSSSSSSSTTKLLSPIKLPPLPSHLINSPNLSKPQLLFPKRLIITIPSIDSKELPLWKPILIKKLNSNNKQEEEGSDSNSNNWLLTEFYSPPPPHHLSTIPSDPKRLRYSNPYKEEFKSLKPTSNYFLLPTIPIPHSINSFKDVPFSWIDTKEGLKKMIEEIREIGECINVVGSKDLAIDLEHHSMRSWSGMSSLIQLSTRKKDYVIDCLKPEVMEVLESLNEFFTNPSWIKVFHGANSDIIWLQRDFGLYIVGLFDTYHATHVLDFPQHSLASLLAKYTNFVPDKRYQLADWRIRPIPEEMLHYARSDTHFLLSIYDHLRIALHALPTPPPLVIESKEASIDEEAVEGKTIVYDPPLLEVFNRSIVTSSAVFEILPYTPDTGLHKGWRTLLSKWHVSKEYSMAVSVPTLPRKTGWGPGEIKLEILKTLHYWREKVAREEDESTEFILSNKALEEICKHPTKIELELFLIIGKSYGGLSEIVRRRKLEMIEAIEKGMENVTVGLVGEEPEVELERMEVVADRGVEAIEPAVQTLPGLWDSPIAATPATSTEVVPMEVEEVIPEAPKVVVSKSIFSSMFGGSKKKVSTPVPTAIVPVITPVATPSVPVITPAIVAPKSSLFAAASSIFGGGKKKVGKKAEVVVVEAATVDKGKGKEVAVVSEKEEARLSAIARIHASLVLGGGLADSLRAQSIPEPARLPTPPSSSIATPTVVVEDQEDVSMDHSYVPLSGRMPKPLDSTTSSSSAPSIKQSKSDIIVVSSLTDKPKKRRRNNPTTVEDTIILPGQSDFVEPEPLESPTKERTSKKPKKAPKSTEPMERLEPFDYSNVRSVLDSEPQGSRTFAGGKKDKKKEAASGGNKKGFEVDLTGFRKTAPRVNNAPKRGNVSKSFEK